jgi:hypothetical protein
VFVRFATVLLYLTDVDLGGETVFIHGKPLDGTWVAEDEALQAVGRTNEIFVRTAIGGPTTERERKPSVPLEDPFVPLVCICIHSRSVS